MIAIGVALRLWAADALPETSTAALASPPETSAASAIPPETPAAPPTNAVTRSNAANILFFQALGSGLFYSVNYERYVESWNIGVRVGGSFVSIPVSRYGESQDLVVLSFPITASYYVGARNHKLQLGLGATLLYTDAASDTEGIRFDSERSGFGAAATAIVGYRYIPSDGGLSFGVSATPLLRTTKFLPWGGVDVGYAF